MGEAKCGSTSDHDVGDDRIKKRLIICGSPRSRGRSAGLAEALRLALQESYPHDEVILITLADYRVAPCMGCNACARNVNVPSRDDLYCVIADDMARLRNIVNACDDLTVVTPVYFAGVPSQLKAFLDRFQPYYYSNWQAGKPKRSAHVYVVGEGGDPHGFVPLVSVVRSALSVAGFALATVHDWVGRLSPDGAPLKGASLQEDYAYPASSYVCMAPDGVYPLTLRTADTLEHGGEAQ